MHLKEFDTLLKNIDTNIDDIIKLIKDNIDKLNQNNFNEIADSLFHNRKNELHFLFKTQSKIFYDIYYYLGLFNHNTKDDQLLNILNNDGLCVLEKFFSSDQIDDINIEFNTYFNKIEHILNDNEKVKNGSYRERIENMTLDIDPYFEGKNRIAFSRDNAPKILSSLFNNETLIQFVKNYYNNQVDIICSGGMYERVNQPKFYRDDHNWHIDTLHDQFKIMIVLKDMTETSAPFTYIPGFHKNFTQKQEDKYHKMYKLGGLQGGYLNHFNDLSLDGDKGGGNIQKAILKAGDVVLFDTKIQHSVSYAFNNGSRDIVMIYFSRLNTVRNKLLGLVDKSIIF